MGRTDRAVDVAALAHALADAPVLLVSSSREAGEHASEELRAALADLERGEHAVCSSPASTTPSWPLSLPIVEPA